MTGNARVAEERHLAQVAAVIRAADAHAVYAHERLAVRIRLTAEFLRENVELVMKNLATSEELSAMVKSGELKIVGGIYDLDTGTIEMLKN